MTDAHATGSAVSHTTATNDIVCSVVIKTAIMSRFLYEGGGMCLRVLYFKSSLKPWTYNKSDLTVTPSSIVNDGHSLPGQIANAAMLNHFKTPTDKTWEARKIYCEFVT